MASEVKPKILIVEDERISAESIKKSLLGFGYQVTGIAANYSEALSLAHDSLPDLILMDIQLRGDVDGVMTAQRVQLELEIPVVYLTAHTDNNTISRALHSGFYGFVSKPYSDAELNKAIETALERHRFKRQSKE